MILAVDVDYRDGFAIAAGVLFRDWTDKVPTQEVTVEIPEVKAYIPGKFYQRELPCILAVLQHLEEKPEIIVVDGYVYLGEAQKPGLGHYLYDALNGEIAVIGVAKSFFRGTPEEDTAVYRGKSKRPLYVTAVGIDLQSAKKHIRMMAGDYRMPALLKRVDQLCRE